MAATTAQPSVFSDALQGKLLSESVSKFALALYQTHCKEHGDDNVFISPISITMALAMTYLGTRGRTMEQMKNGMSLQSVDEKKLHQTFSELRVALQGASDKEYSLHMANRLFGQKSFGFLDEYLNLSKTFYGSSLAAVDFEKNLKAAIDEINKFVAQNTNEKIKEIVSESSLSADTRLVIVNAIYFKGSWKDKFDGAVTKEEQFFITKNNAVKIPMMYKGDASVYYGVSEELHCQAVELPYVGDRLSFFVLLPDSQCSDVKQLISQLNPDHLHNPRASLNMYYKRDVNIWLPRFKLDVKLELVDVLKQLGIEDLFTPGGADLSGINGAKNLVVSKVLHRAYVDVNEEGTEAAAATAIGIMLCSMPIPTNFRADHPFVFFIYDSFTQSVLFLGKFMKPE